MKTNKILLATIFLVVAILSVLPVISAAAITVAWNDAGAISNYSNQTGSFAYNCTTSAAVITNVTVYANSSAGVMNPLQVFTNTTPDQTAWNGTVTITGADDGLVQNISCYAQNATAGVYSDEDACHDIMLDTTDPLCSLVTSHKTFAWKGTQLITWTSSDTIERVSTLVTIDRPEDGADITDSDANEARTLTSQETKYIGDWTATILVTDRVGLTCTETVTFKTYLGDGEIWEPTAPPIDRGKTLLLLLIVGVVLWFIFGNKKK